MNNNPDKKIADLELLLVQRSEKPENLRERLLLENESLMRQAASRQELAEIADDTLAKLATLYGGSVNALEQSLITEVYKPAFAIVRNLEKDQASIPAKDFDIGFVNDGFSFDLFLNEIETLADADLKAKARELFYDAIGSIRVGMDIAENYAIADRTSKELKKMYRNSVHFAHDYARLEGQLFRAAGQRNQFLRKIGKWEQNQSSGM